jgi:lysophospholipase L1-like esterase
MLLLLACTPTGSLLTPSGSAFGHWRAEVAVEQPVQSVWVGDRLGYDLEQVDGVLSFTVQGGSGEEDVILFGADGEQWPVDVALVYDPPVDGLFDRVVGIGASLTMGVQDGVPTTDAQLMSPGAQITRAAGADYGIPLLVDPLFPKIGPEHLGPTPECALPSVGKHVTDAVIDVLGRLNDAEGDFHYSLGRVDPDMSPHNAAVGGYQISDLTTGTDEFTKGFIGHLVLDPYGGMNDDIAFSQVELVLEHDPTLVLSFDTFGNDIIGAVVLGNEIEVGNITDEAAFLDAVDRLLEALGASDAQVFLSNSPRPGLLPAGRLLVLEADDPEAAQLLVDEADAITVRYNELLADAAEGYDNIHVVDAWSYAEELNTLGLDVGGQHLDVLRFGGLLSLDGVHFTDAGYASMAQLFMDAIESELGVALTPLDLEAIVAADDRSPAALEAAGVDLEACWR